ncbi:MAG: cytochrome c3 family protein [Gammaproteobacteria bacterium]|jgi:hypothetical protein|nr:cytochrome c3 family protein [Gammaproteobacteria bacterium]
MRGPAWFVGVLGMLWMATGLAAGPVSDIANTRHNLSATLPPGDVERRAAATEESQICVFCHTPHGATPEYNAPLWNRQLSQATYITYDSSSMDATDLGQPSGRSKLCLSCHDGTIALGAVNVLNRDEPNRDGRTVSVDTLNASPPGTMPHGHGTETGFTRYIGIDLTNDHPISFTFDSAQAVRDGELFDPVSTPWLDERTRRIDGEARQPLPRGLYLPLERDVDGVGPKVECITCHDPHVRSQVPGENIKFLRVNRLQQHPPVQGQFDAQRDIICLACHDKEGWAGSAHANPAVADERYTEAAAAIREFPSDTRVWQAACLNCHDPHTVQGSRRILREGTDGPLMTDPVTGAQFRQGGDPAIEQVCYSCHGDPALGPPTPQTLQGQINPSANPAFEVPDVKTDFTTMRTHMPISNTDQLSGREVHSIGTGDAATQGTERGQDFVESRELLGVGGLANRHAECTDCHNPHRVQRTRLFNDDPTVPSPGPTHEHGSGVPHTNLASGVLRGIWGVEPVYANTAFGNPPVDFQVKRGDPGVGGSTDVNAPYLTREYQLCLKCHSNYAYDVPPPLGYTSGLTPAGTNSLFNYTNQAMEFLSPLDHQGETTPATPTGAYVGAPAPVPAQVDDSSGTGTATYGRTDPQGNLVDYVTNNHRSWHPTMQPTGRTPAVRGADANAWRPPFNAAVGTQTMYCTDCHGSRTPGDTVVPFGGENGFVWGPHGSDENFILKGNWSDQTGEATTNFANEADPSNHLCFRCHDPKNYARAAFGPGNPDVVRSGFRRAVGGGGCLPFLGTNLHVGHAAAVQNFRCTYCHIAIPHGWKNKVFLANLNDVGLEAELPPGTQVRYTGFPQSGTARYYQGPYYLGTTLKVRSFARSGEWLDVNCGSAGFPGNGIVGVDWMNNSSEACVNPP